MVANRLPEPLEEGPASPLTAEPPEPMVTFSLNGVPMRFKAGQLRALMGKALSEYGHGYADDLSGVNGAKLKAFQLAMQGAFTGIMPLARQAIEKIRDNPKTPAYVKRMLLPLPPIPKRSDRFLFFTAYMTECFYAALTENAWELEVTADDPSDPTAMQVTGFTIRDPKEFSQRAMLPAPEGDAE